MFTSSILLFLFTLHFIFDDSSCNLSKAASLPYSEIVEINDATKMAITIPIVSNQSKSLNRKIVLIARAINNIFIIGSPNVSIKSFIKLFFSFELIWLVPYFFLLSITSFVVRPFIFFLLEKTMMAII